jgi:fatty acid desaturase
MNASRQLDCKPQRNPYQYYRAQLLSPERVRELSAIRGSRVVLDTLFCWLVIVLAWTAVAIWPYWWTALFAIPLIGSRYYALFIIGHDGLHQRLFANKRYSDLFSDLLILGAIGAVTRINNRNHLQHHLYLATERDPDRHKHACFNKANLAQVVGYLTGLTSVVQSVRNVFFPQETSDVEEGKNLTDKTNSGYTWRNIAILAGWQLLLLGGLSWFIGFWAYPVLWLLPVYLFTFLADGFRSFAEHSQPESDADADEHRLITFLSNPVERLFIAPMNMNYHAVHHLWTSIPYYNLPQADREVRTMSATQGLEWRGSYVRYLLRYCRSLPLEKCKAGVQAHLT